MAYKWTDNPTESGKSPCNTDVLNECLMHLKYEALTEEQSPINNLLETLYPVGAIFIGTMATCPLTILGVGTWQLEAQDRVLQGSGSKAADTTVEAGLPNITGTFGTDGTTGSFVNGGQTSGAFYNNTTTRWTISANQSINGTTLGFDASRSSAIYGNSNTVQPPAYVVNIWRRTA